MPAIIGYGAMTLSLFVFLRRRAPAPVALIASVLSMLVPISQYAIQARPYALLLGCSGWALVFWQRAAEKRTHRLAALIGFYLSLTCAILTQYLGAFLFIPFIAGELWRSFRYRRIDLAMWVAFIAAATAVVAYIPFLPTAFPYRAHPWHGVLIEDLAATYLLSTSAAVVAVISLCCVVWLIYQRSDYRGSVIELRGYECVALGTYYCVPVLSFAVAKLMTHSYHPRYSLMFGIAAAVLTSVIIHCLTRYIAGLTTLLLLLLLAQAAFPIKEFLHPLPQNTRGISDSQLPIVDKFGDLPIAVADFNNYVMIYLYGPAQLKRRMVLVSDPSAITEYGNNMALADEAVYRAMNSPGARYKQFLESHSQFLLLGTYWLRDQVLRDGRRVIFLGQVFGRDLYYLTESSRTLGQHSDSRC